MKEKSYNLFGSTWIIQFVDEVVDENDKWLFGETESPSRVITISTVVNFQRMKLNLLSYMK